MKERYQAIEEKNSELKDILAKKKPIVTDFLSRFEMSWIYHDNALEGTVYPAQELQAALHPGAVATEATLMPVILDIRNHVACLQYIREEAKTASKRAPAVTMAQVKKIHDLLSGNTPEARAARAAVERREKSDRELAKEKERLGYRRDMPLHRTYFHEIAQPSKIPGALEKLIDTAASSDFKELNPLHQAAAIQHGIIQIFPFTDHSGKVGRMASNMVLLRHGFFPCVVHAIDRQRYYETFRGPVAGFRNFMLDALENSIDNALKYFRDAARKYKAVNS